MDRRDFLRLAAGGSVALALAPFAVAPVSPHWVYVEVGSFVKALDSFHRFATIHAQRNDGLWFFVAIGVEERRFTERNIDAHIENGRKTLDEFLTCGCGPDGRCAYHTATFPKPGDDVWCDALPS